MAFSEVNKVYFDWFVISFKKEVEFKSESKNGPIRLFSSKSTTFVLFTSLFICGGMGFVESEYTHNKIQLIIKDNKQLELLRKNIGRLTGLLSLYLSNNQLTELPEEIFELTQLKYLDLSDNQLESLPEDIGKLTQLQELHLFNNKQLKSLPEDIGKLEKLEYLHLSNNQLKSLPKEIGKLKDSLKLLDLSGNSIMETCTDEKNLGRRELEDIFGKRVRF